MPVKLPKIPAGLRDTVTTRDVLQPGARIERVIVRGVEAINIAAPKLYFDEAALDRVVLVNAALGETTMLDVEVRGCDFSAAVLSSGACTRVRFTNCRMAGVDFSHAKLQNVTFEDCKLDMANFRFARLHNVQFQDCTFVEADFQVAEIHDVAFQGCTLQHVIFDQCKIQRVDARGSTLRNIHGWRNMRNVQINYEQLIGVAPELASELGVVVAD